MRRYARISRAGAHQRSTHRHHFRRRAARVLVASCGDGFVRAGIEDCDDGKVRNWGLGTYLGYGDPMNIGDGPGEMPPANVATGGIAIAISRGTSDAQHTCVMLQDYTVRCWGRSSYGQLGYGDTQVNGDGPGEMPPPPVQAY